MNIMNHVTLKGLKKNTTRTIVTIIGIILSTAMITAVTTFASSIQNYILNYTIAREGDWHGMVDTSDAEVYQKIQEDDRFRQVSVVRDGGYAPLKGGVNEYKPYLYIMELDDQSFDTLPIHLTEGRLPQNANEVVIPDHILSNGGVEYKIGDEINLEVGQRYIDGEVLNQNNALIYEEEGESEEHITGDGTNQEVEQQDTDGFVLEEFRATGTRTFTVVGISERFSYRIEGFSAPGYSIITKFEESSVNAGEEEHLNIYFKANKPREIYDIELEFYQEYEVEGFALNSDVLRYQGISDIDSLNAVVYGLATIIMILIMVGSISLIYNSFSISVSERKKQFGLLSSVGATRKQLVNSVFFEAFFIAVIGIPLGIGSGIVGIGITLFQLKDNFTKMLGLSVPVELTLSISTLSVIMAIILSFITILISAYIPARRTKKVSAMDAVRQNEDVKLTAKNVKTSFITRKVFGLEGDLALKNLKRNRRRYRSTVFSLFISVLLFISASAFSMYLRDSVTNVYEDYNYDISYDTYYNAHEDESLSKEQMEAYEDIRNLESIQDGSIIRASFLESTLSKEQVQPSYYLKMIEQGFVNEGEDLSIYISLFAVDHETFSNYVNELGLNQEKYQNADEITAIAVDKQHSYDIEENRYVNTSMLKEQSETSLEVIDWEYQDNNLSIPIVLGDFAETTPLGVQEYHSSNGIILIVDDEVILNADNKMKDFYWRSYQMYFESEEPFLAVEEIEKILTDEELHTSGIYNAAEQVEDNRNTITILNVFAYGFIILMSLITIANVFNTITTNINLRRREFAMLKSVGMTSRSFHKMLNYECIFYGLKALLYGIPVSTFVTYLIYKSIQQGVDMNFYLPIQSIVISIFSVFFVVFISMMYSMRKIKKENILDALKNENM